MRLPDNAEVSNELWDDVIECLKQRLGDKVPLIRTYAVRALSRFAIDCENSDVLDLFLEVLHLEQNAVSVSTCSNNYLFFGVCLHENSISFFTNTVMYLYLVLFNTKCLTLAVTFYLIWCFLFPRIVQLVVLLQEMKTLIIKQFALVCNRSICLNTSAKNSVWSCFKYHSMVCFQEVRKTILLSLPPSNGTSQTIIDCTMDVSESCRKAAYYVLADKFPLQSLR